MNVRETNAQIIDDILDYCDGFNDLPLPPEYGETARAVQAARMEMGDEIRRLVTEARRQATTTVPGSSRITREVMNGRVFIRVAVDWSDEAFSVDDLMLAFDALVTEINVRTGVLGFADPEQAAKFLDMQEIASQVQVPFPVNGNYADMARWVERFAPEVVEALRHDLKIVAIKECRIATHLGLKEAKNIIDYMSTRMS